MIKTIRPTFTAALAVRLRENPMTNHQSLHATARKEVEALGYLTSQTAIALRSSGVDPAAFERRVLDSAI